jgi:hypothetical protein
MKKILFIFLFLFFSTPAFAANQEIANLALDSLNFKLKLGNYYISAPYHLPGDVVLDEGYLISVPDLALLKVEIDSIESTMAANLNLLSKQCQAELANCQQDADDRFVDLVKENDFLSEKLSLQESLYRAQKTKTIIYTLSGVFITGLTSFLIVKMVY